MLDVQRLGIISNNDVWLGWFDLWTAQRGFPKVHSIYAFAQLIYAWIPRAWTKARKISV